jgi:CHAT domain-containing protein/tetratricopeptide (TPR) repeat protein
MVIRSKRLFIAMALLLSPILSASQSEFHEDSVINNLKKRGDLERAIVLQSENSAFFKTSGDWSGYFQSERRKARTLQSNRQFDKALEILNVALDDCKKQIGEYSIDYVQCAKAKAELYRREGYWDEVFEALLDAERVALKLPDAEKQLHAIYANTGRMYYQSGDYVAALPNFRKRLSLSKQLHKNDSLALGKAYYNMGSTYWGLDERDSCKTYYAEAINLWKGAFGEDFEYLKYMYDVLGSYAWEEGENEEALRYFNRAGEIGLKGPQEENEADQLQTQAEGLAEQGLLDEALKGYQDALAFRVENLGWQNVSTAGCYNYIARTLAMMDDPEAALQTCVDALVHYCPGFEPNSIYDTPTEVTRMNGLHFLLDILIVRFDILLSIEDSSKQDEVRVAIKDNVNLCVEVIDKLRTGKRGERSQVFWTNKVNPFFETAIGHYEQYFAETSDSTALEDIFLIMEKSRAFVLNQANRQLEAMDLAGIPVEVQQRERDLKKSLSDLEAFIDSEEKRCAMADVDKLDIWREEEVKVRLEYTQFIASLEHDYPEYYRLKYDPQTIDLDSLQSTLETDVQLFSFFVGTERAYVLKVSRSNCAVWSIENPETMNAHVEELRALIASPERHLNEPQLTYEAFTTTSTGLYNLVFDPLWSVSAKTVIIPDGSLNYLPFDLLLTDAPPEGKRNYRALNYLLKSTSISFTPSASLYNLQMNGAKKPDVKYAGFAPSYEGLPDEVPQWSNINGLKFNATEVDLVKELLGGDIFQGTSASEAIFKRESGEAAILHLAMHTQILDEEPNLSGFLFNGPDDEEDGVLRAHEIYTLSLAAQLAVLSSCNTGEGQFQRGEGVMSLARGFSYAGCPSILMSLWECDDRSTQELVEAFFTHVLEGKTKSDALRDAKMDYLAECDEAQAFPYYWSGLTLVGNTDTITLPETGMGYWMIALIILVLTSLVFLRKRLS